MTDDKTGDKASRLPDLNRWMTTTEVARALGVGTAFVLQYLCATGNYHRGGELGLTDVIETPLGRLFNPEEVEFLRQARAEAKAPKTAS